MANVEGPRISEDGVMSMCSLPCFDPARWRLSSPCSAAWRGASAWQRHMTCLFTASAHQSGREPTACAP
eukprot:9456911-Karenia_brevis.AAC.1